MEIVSENDISNENYFEGRACSRRILCTEFLYDLSLFVPSATVAYCGISHFNVDVQRGRISNL